MEELKKEIIAGSYKLSVGSKNLDLVLKTLGKVYIQSGSRLTLLQDLLQSKTITSGNIVDLDSHNKDPNAHPLIQDKMVSIEKSIYQLPLRGKDNTIYFVLDEGETYVWGQDRWVLVGKDPSKIELINGNLNF